MAISLDSGLSLEIGEHSYIHDAKIRNPSGALTRIRIGKFCSIATHLTVIGYDHHSEWISMYPFLDDGNREKWPGTNGIAYPQAAEFGSNKNRGDIEIGNDVWIGYEVKIFKGVTIGNGAVIGACSLVNKSVEPYTIIAGIPAKPIRKRFPDKEIAFLEKIKWWDWPAEMINRYMASLCSGSIAEMEAKLEQEEQVNNTLDLCNECLNRGEFPAALEGLSRALTLAPRHPQILSNRGQLRLFLKDCDGAKVDFAEALIVDAGCAAAHSGMARYHWEKGLHEEAEACANRALTINPADEDAMEVLSAVKRQNGHKKSVFAFSVSTRENVAPQANETSAKAAITTNSHELAVQGLRQFLAAGNEYLADVEPPELTEANLRNSRILPSREHLLPLMLKGGVCAEVGSQTGDFAKQIFSVLQPAKLHLYDIDFTLFDRAHFESAINKGQVELHEGDSSSLLGRMPDRHFDFIYVDGDHAYEGVVRDLEQAARKVKDDGWIVCNDYTLYSPLEKAKYGVYRAVNEFCLKHDFEIVYLGLHFWGYHDVALRKRQQNGEAVSHDVSNGSGHRRSESYLMRNGVDISINKNGNGPASAALNGHNGAAKSPEIQRHISAKSESGFPGPGRALEIIEEIGQGDEMFAGDKAHYFGVGESALRCIQAGMFSANKQSDTVHRILDLPCGHGRVMRFLKASFPQAQLTACDLNRGAVDFCAKTFGAQPVYSNTDVSRISVGGTFDLIWCGSLLTHLRPEGCSDFVRFFDSLLNPGGLAIFTLHGRWVERSLATGRYKYGLRDEDVHNLLQQYYRTGFGYADYPGTTGYGISVSSPSFVQSELISLPLLKLVGYHEKGWDNHQDVVCLQKQTPAEPLG